MLKFYIPILYSFQTRFNTKIKRIGWVLTYFFPVALMFFLLSSTYTIQLVSVLLLGIFSIYTVYEIGYIENDAETIKKEKNPTLRLTKIDLKYYESNKFKIYLSRIFILFMLLAGLVLLDINIKIFSLLLLSLLVLFKIYNLIRSRLNLFIQFFLSSIRYLSVPLLALDFIPYQFLIFIFIFPLINFLEWMTKERFHIKWMITFKEHIDLLRVIYYILSVLLGVVFFQENQFFNVYIVIINYFLLYRIFTYMLSKKIDNRGEYK